MGFGPIISALMRNKTGPMLVALQIAVTLAIVVNSLFIIIQRVEHMNRDSGIDVENVFVVYVRGFGDDFDVVDSIRNDIDLIQSIPGVVAATVSIAKVMGADTVAEHVENDLVLQRLKRHEIDYFQGFAISRPEPLADVLASMDSHAEIELAHGEALPS